MIFLSLSQILVMLLAYFLIPRYKKALPVLSIFLFAFCITIVYFYKYSVFVGLKDKVMLLTHKRFFALLISFVIFTIVGYFNDNKTVKPLINVFFIFIICLFLIKMDFILYKSKIFIFYIEKPGSLLSFCVLFIWLFFTIGFVEILSSAEFIFIFFLIFFSLGLRFIFNYIQISPFLLNEYFFMYSLLLLVYKFIFKEDFKIGRTISYPMGFLIGIIPYITRIKSFTFVTFMAPVLIFLFFIFFIYFNFFAKTLLLRSIREK